MKVRSVEGKGFFAAVRDDGNWVRVSEHPRAQFLGSIGGFDEWEIDVADDMPVRYHGQGGDREVIVTYDDVHGRTVEEFYYRRHFRYVGKPCLTRGQSGVNVRGGHTTDEAPDHITIWDPDCGDLLVTSAEAGLKSGDWVEVSEEEWASL